MRPQIILDTETTSLVPDYATGKGVIWELALIERDCGAERLYRVQPDTALADQAALAVGRFDERTKLMQHSPIEDSGLDSGVTDIAWTGYQIWSRGAELAWHLENLLDGATIIAANPTFDAGFLSALFDANGCKRRWHYRLRDIGSMAWAWLQAPGRRPAPPMDASTDDFARALGGPPPTRERCAVLPRE